MRRFSSVVGITAVMCALCLIGLTPKHSTTRAAYDKSLPGEPLKVTRVSMSETRAAAGEKSAAGVTWLDGLAVEVENTSGKAIKFLEVRVRFASGISQGRKPLLSLQHGRIGAQPAGSQKAAPFPPGARLTLTPAASIPEEKRRVILKGSQAPSPGGGVATEVGVVVFEDGTAWGNGMLHAPDPEKPARWNVVRSGFDEGALVAGLVPGIIKASFMPKASPAPARRSDCGRHEGFEVLYDCCPGMYVFSNIVVPDPNGNAQLEEVTERCSLEGPYCTYYITQPCQ